MRTEHQAPEVETSPARGGRTLIFGVLPLVLLAVVVAGFFAFDPLKSLRKGFPPVEELTFERVVVREEPREIVVRLRNGGPTDVTVSQVLIDDAYWTYTIDPGPAIARLGAATITIPYPWVEFDAHHLRVLTNTGVAFDHEIAVAVATPAVGGRELGVLALLGVYVGVIPVFLGLLWYPFLRGLKERWINFFLAVTGGLLVFLAVDAIHEALEIAPGVPGAFQGVGLVTVGLLASLGTLFGAGAWMRRRRGGSTPLYVATLVAAGIGLHNLGEGLAIGSAYALGEIGLTTFLILGFTLHNTTEGLGIVAPLAAERPRLLALLGLGLLAGGPTVAGSWIGGLAYNPTLAVLFLAIGAGAIIQVVWEIAKLMRRGADELAAPLNAAGFLFGVAVMYVTGLLVAA